MSEVPLQTETEPGGTEVADLLSAALPLLSRQRGARHVRARLGLPHACPQLRRPLRPGRMVSTCADAPARRVAPRTEMRAQGGWDYA